MGQHWRTYLGTIFIILWLMLVAGIVVYFHFVVPPFVAVPTSSMVPAIGVGDLVIVHPVPPSQVRVGQIIVVDLPPAMQSRYHYPPSVMHRVIAISDRRGQLRFRTQGDANPLPDPYTVLPAWVGARVVHIYRGWGYPILFVHSIPGKVFLALVVLWMVGQDIRDSARPKRDIRTIRRRHGSPVATPPSGEERDPERAAAAATARKRMEQWQQHTQAVQQLRVETERLRRITHRMEKFLTGLPKPDGGTAEPRRVFSGEEE